MDAYAQTYTYDFSNGNDSWTGDFADYPVTDSIFYELEFVRDHLPSPLNKNQFALKINGNNHSDGLFMFIKRKISGLKPNTIYKLLIDVTFASKAPTNSTGVGGSPGEGVTMKAGGTIVEPVKLISNGYYKMNINKGDQSRSGTDMDTIGNVGVSDTTTVFTLINRNNSSHLFTITSNANGEVWVCIGTDSGFEATTTLYYKLINLTFTSINGINEINSPKIIICPNPAKEILYVRINSPFLYKSYTIVDQLGKICLYGKFSNNNYSIDIHNLNKGLFFLVVNGAPNLSYKFVVE